MILTLAYSGLVGNLSLYIGAGCIGPGGFVNCNVQTGVFDELVHIVNHYIPHHSVSLSGIICCMCPQDLIVPQVLLVADLDIIPATNSHGLLDGLVIFVLFALHLIRSNACIFVSDNDTIPIYHLFSCCG